MFFKALFKHPKVMELFDYKDKPNELDRAVERIDKTLEDVAIGQEAIKSVFKGFQDQIDLVKKMAHPPKEFTKDIDSIKSQISDIKTKVSGFTAFFNKMKKLPLLKSIFK